MLELDLIRETVARWWGDLLGEHPWSDASDFFEMGGDSMSLMLLSAQMQQQFGVAVGIATFMEDPTFGHMVDVLARAERRAGDDDQARPHTPDAQGLPVSYQLERKLAREVAALGAHRHGVRHEFEISGNLNVEALSRAVDAVVSRHPLLRSRFARIDGEFRIVGCEQRPHLEVESATADGDEPGSDTGDRPGFDLWQGPLAAFRLWKAGTSIFTFVVAIDHYVCDGWSARVLMSDLTRAYSLALGSPAAIELEPPRAGYGDYVEAQRSALTSERGRELISYWHGRLAGVDRNFEFPGVVRSTRNGYAGYSVEHVTPPGAWSAATVCARKLGVTPFSLWLSLVATALIAVTGRRDFVVQTASANRIRPELEDVVGYFSHGLLIRLTLLYSPDTTYQQFVGDVAEQANSAFRHQDLPYSLLLREVYPDQYLDLPSVDRMYLDLYHDARLDLDGVSVRPVLSQRQRADPGLNMWVVVHGADSASLEFACGDYIPRFLPEGFGRVVLRMAQAVAEKPERPVEDLIEHGTKWFLE